MLQLQWSVGTVAEKQLSTNKERVWHPLKAQLHTIRAALLRAAQVHTQCAAHAAQMLRVQPCTTDPRSRGLTMFHPGLLSDGA